MSTFLADVTAPGVATLTGKQPKPVKPPPVQHLPRPVQTGPPVHPNLVPPDGPPVPVLQQNGFHGSINQFGQRVSTIVAAHKAQTGAVPKPMDVLALATNTTVTDKHLAAIFTGPNTDYGRQAAAAVAAHPIVTDGQLVNQLAQAAKGDSYRQFLDDNTDAVTRLQSDKKWAAKVHGIILGRSERDAQAHVAKANAAGLADAGLIARPAGQIIESLIHAPGGLVALAHAVGSDIDAANPLNAQHFGQSDASFKRSRVIGGALAHSFAEDFRHPGRNSGYLFLDLLGLASVGAGATARVAAAGRAARAGEGVAAAGKALVTKPPLQTAEVRLGDYTEQMPLSSNPLVALAQKKILGVRQTAADKRLEEGPSPLRSLIRPIAAQEFLDANLSFERKVGREADARQRVEHIARMALANDLDQAAGTALRHSRVMGRIPVSKKGGLTRGEQKAIQVLSWDDPDPLAAERAFHERMIARAEGGVPGISIKAHEVHLADLKLAEKALANPRGKFLKALALTREVVADMQRQKIEELGLTPETAEGRIVKAAEVLRGEEQEPRLKPGAVPGEPGKPEFGGFYLPTQPRGKVKRQPSQVRGKFGVSAGPYGVPPGREMPELTHEFTGSALRAGDIRIDATNLASEAYARTVRAVTVKNQHAKLWEVASPTKRSEWDIPIRDVNEIQDELRPVIAKLDEGDFTQTEAELLPKDMAELIRALYPDERGLTPDEIEHVRWIDSRLLGDHEGAPSRSAKAVTKLLQAVNSPFRFFALYARPAYALNKLGNEAMLVFDQGFLNSLENLSRATSAEHLYGERNAATMRALVGAGKSRSYVTGQSGRVSRWLAEAWNRFADRDERVASFTYYADRKGYVTREQMDSLLNDPANRGDLSEVTRRANAALVTFDNLTPFEKNVLRHLIFVYPWVRGSAVWSLRAIMEHPAKVDLLAHLGQQAIENDPLLDKATAWFKRIGYIPIGWNHDGTPKVVNPTSINTFSTLQDFLSIGQGATMGDKYASVSDVLGPAAKFGIHLSTGRDDFGNQYPGSQWAGAAKEVLFGLPQLTHLKSRKDKPLTPFDVRKRTSLEANLNSHLRETVFTPGWLDGYASLIIGGLNPRGVNTQALEARYWADQDPAVRERRHLNLLNRALNMQGEFLAKAVPAEVRQSVRDHAAISVAYGQFQKNTGRAPTLKEKAGLQLKYLTGKGRIPDAEAKKLGRLLTPLTDEQQIRDFQTHLADKYTAGKDLRQWDSDVRLLYSFRKDTFNLKAARLHGQGLAPQRTYNVPQEKLYEYGRKYLAFAAKVRAMKADKNAAAADLRLLTDENSKPVNGLPSFAAIAWSNQTPEEQKHALLADTGVGWAKLTAVEKQLLGKPVDPSVTEAWTAYEKLTTREALAKQLPAGQRTLDKNQRASVVKQIDRYYGLHGKFLADYQFAREPLYQRLPYMTVMKRSSHRQDWRDLLARAAQLAAAVKDKRTTGRAASDAWRDYVAQLPAFYQAERPEFWKELAPILDANPKFLEQVAH